MSDYTRWKGKVTDDINQQVFVLPAQDSQYSLGTDTEQPQPRGLYLSLTSQSAQSIGDTRVLISKRNSDMSFLAQDIQVVKNPAPDAFKSEDLRQLQNLRASNRQASGRNSLLSNRGQSAASNRKNSLRPSASAAAPAVSSGKTPAISSGKTPAISSVTTPAVSIMKPKKFNVSFGPKNRHIWSAINESNLSIYINGANGPVLRLKRGMTYYFCVDASEHTFMLSPYPMVAKVGEDIQLLEKDLVPITSGVVVLKVTDRTPKYFYYLSTTIANAGGLIIVEDLEK